MKVKTIEHDLKWLRKKSKPVDIMHDKLVNELKDLKEYSAKNGVFAMAANQLGYLKRVIYIKNTRLDKIDDGEWNEDFLMINPVIKKREGIAQYWEACASCLDNMALVLRPYKMIVEYCDLNNVKHQKTFKDFPAVVISHEYDHLDCILHMDKALDIKIMEVEARQEFRKTHDYEVLQEDGDFMELEVLYHERYKK